MKLFRIRAKRALLISGLAAALAMLTVDTASAQRRHLPLPPPVNAKIQLGDAAASFQVGSSYQRGRHDRSHRVTIPRGYDGGRYEWRNERVWVPGRSERVWEPPVYEWRYEPCGRRYRVCVSQGFWRTIQHPGCYETRRVRVWVPAPCIDVRRGYGRRDHRVTQIGRRFGRR